MLMRTPGVGIPTGVRTIVGYLYMRLIVKWWVELLSGSGEGVKGGSVV